MTKFLLTLEIPIQSAIGDEKLAPKIVQMLRSGEGDVAFFGITRLVSRAKRPKDSTEAGPMRVDWKGVS